MHSDSETIGVSASLPCKTESTEDLISSGVNVVFETSNQDDGNSMCEGTYATATTAVADATIARNNLIAYFPVSLTKCVISQAVLSGNRELAQQRLYERIPTGMSKYNTSRKRK
mmetsp:Transcript_3069/g.6649  ORF Transcript_3069/g.6649 Transcript_3069/m.6649 type:complete len:114 (-) Transcript_3069:4-345(-)